MEPYPALLDETIEDIALAYRTIQRMRDDDITDTTNYPNIFMSGRKVSKIPTSSVDIADTDRIGDFNYTNAYLYLCVDDTGAAWRRIALGAF